MFDTVNQISDLSVLLVDSAHGQYAPQVFATTIDRDRVVPGTVRDDTFEILEAGPDHEYYWESWDDVLNNMELTTDNGDVVRIHQDGDVWAYLIPSSVNNGSRRTEIMQVLLYDLIKQGNEDVVVDWAIAHLKNEHADPNITDQWMDEAAWEALYGP